MDSVILVEDKIEDGMRLLGRLGDAGFVVRAACWVKPAEKDRWSLYIVTPAVDEEGSLAAYGRVNRVLRSIQEEWVAWVTSSEIKLLGVNHPVAQALLANQQRFSGKMLTGDQIPYFGGIQVEEVYLYASMKGNPVKIYGMSFPGAPGDVLHLSLEPHSVHSVLQCESDGQTIEYPAQTGFDWIVAAPEEARLERDTIGRMTLVWDVNGQRKEFSANDVWTFAKLGLHGFRFLNETAENVAQASVS